MPTHQPIRPAAGLHPKHVRDLKTGTLIDPSCPGLRIVATATRRTWIYRFETGGRMKQTRIW